MSSLNVPVGDTLEVIGADSIRYKGNVYTNVTSIRLADGTTTTCAAILQAAGGVSYSSNELKRCVKVEGYDPDNSNRQVFTCYSTNSRQTAKNSVGSVPGGLWIEMFNFIGDESTNGLFKLWTVTKPVAAVDYLVTWIGFKMNYGVTDTRSYVLTQSNDFLEESVPTAPVAIDVTYMHDVKISGQFATPAPFGVGFKVPIRTFNLYRSNVTADGFAVYQRVPVSPTSVAPNKLVLNQGVLPHAAYLPEGQSKLYTPAGLYFYNTPFGWEMVDNVLAVDLGVQLPSLDWDAPLSFDLQGLTAWRNGMLVAFTKNVLYFCEPFRPFAWPQKYAIALPFKILALEIDENALIVITDREPFIFTGSHPSNVTYEKMEGVQAGLAPTPNARGDIGPSRAVTKTPKGVVYASPEGPILIASGRGQLLAEALFTREDWALRYKAGYGDMRLAYSDGKLFCYFTTGLTGFYVNLDGPPQLTEHKPVAYPIASHFVSPFDDSLYLLFTLPDGSTYARFADETIPRRTYSYSTRDVIVPEPINFGILQVVAYGPPYAEMKIDVYGGGLLRASIICNIGPQKDFPIESQPYDFRLPSGYKNRRWRVDITTTTTDTGIREIYLAPSITALATV